MSVRSHDGENEIVRRYLERTGKSRALHERFCRVMPAGQTRTITHFDPYPVVVAEGEGPELRDVDGNEYVDVLNNYTSLVHGHRHPEIMRAVRGALGSGTAFPAPHLGQLELAELLRARFPAAEQVRFTNSGSEATLLALRIARAATGRARVVAFEGGYHGTLPELEDGGRDLLRIPYNDSAAVEAALDTSVAAVVVEPFLGSGGVVPALPGFLDEVRARSAAVDALFVIDEVQSLRNHLHGVHGGLALAPDLVLMGKIIGGGFPVGAVAGRAELLAFTDQRHPRALAHSGTFNGNVVTCAAGVASLRLLDEGALERLNERAAALATAIEAAAARAGVTAVVSRAGSIMQVHLTSRYPTAASSPSPRERDAISALHLALILEGVYPAPRGMLNLSTVMTDDHLVAISSGYERAFALVRDALGDLVAGSGTR
jgi:glutamate-1-semialdehyde 2,1-aminomutase